MRRWLGTAVLGVIAFFSPAIGEVASIPFYGTFGAAPTVQTLHRIQLVSDLSTTLGAAVVGAIATLVLWSRERPAAPTILDHVRYSALAYVILMFDLVPRILDAMATRPQPPGMRLVLIDCDGCGPSLGPPAAALVVANAAVFLYLRARRRFAA